MGRQVECKFIDNNAGTGGARKSGRVQKRKKISEEGRFGYELTE